MAPRKLAAGNWKMNGLTAQLAEARALAAAHPAAGCEVLLCPPATLLVPMMVVPAVAGYMFFMLFQSGGPVNDLLSLFAGRPVTIAWLSDPDLALFAVIVSDIWQWTPLMFLILLAGMVSVPQDQQMAAVLLGASWTRRSSTRWTPNCSS